MPAGIPFSPPPAEPSTVSIRLLGCCGAAGWPGGAASYCTTAERRRSSHAQPTLGGRIGPPGELGSGVSCGPHLHPTCKVAKSPSRIFWARPLWLEGVC